MPFQENSVRKAFVYISFEKLYKQPYKLGQKVSNYFFPEYTPPVYIIFHMNEYFLSITSHEI